MNLSRKYIDLIHDASSKYVNWNPQQQFKVGDYGTVNRESGQFEKEGNIYEDPTTAHLAAQHPPLTDIPEDHYIVSSTGVKRHELTLESDLGVSGLANAGIKGQWEFGKKRGALLIVAHPRRSYIPPKVFLKLLIDIPALQYTSLVTEVFSSPAYSLYLSSGNKDIIDVAFVGAIPTTPSGPAGNGVVPSWWARNTPGLFQDACDGNGSHSYTPLFHLKSILRRGLKRRESPRPDPEDDDLWVDTVEPWEQLDEDGQEEDFDDTLYE